MRSQTDLEYRIIIRRRHKLVRWLDYHAPQILVASGLLGFLACVFCWLRWGL